MKNFTLMILCAGFGSRMLNLTRSNPKPLLKYKNKYNNKINKSKIINFIKNNFEEKYSYYA